MYFGRKEHSYRACVTLPSGYELNSEVTAPDAPNAAEYAIIDMFRFTSKDEMMQAKQPFMVAISRKGEPTSAQDFAVYLKTDPAKPKSWWVSAQYAGY